MAIREWPVGERPREKLLGRGPGALSDAELLAVIIGSGSRGRSAVDVGRSLLMEFGSLRALLNADRRRCLAQRGMGPVRFAMLQAALELARRSQSEVLRTRHSMGSPEATQGFLLAQLRDRQCEVFCCLHLDRRRRLIAFEELFRGTIDRANVYPREVARQVLRHNSAGVILAHNHPSGVAEPSEADQVVTRRLQEALALLNVRVLDHIVIGDGQCVSLAERGWL